MATKIVSDMICGVTCLLPTGVSYLTVGATGTAYIDGSSTPIGPVVTIAGPRGIRDLDLYSFEQCIEAWIKDGFDDTFEEWLENYEPAVIFDNDYHNTLIQRK